ncbi:MAG: MFS transporter [Candidatus Lokiarchaeota archaeon]|nr:MFS transporter [Candidatus Lokiarchaeota archaeon]
MSLSMNPITFYYNINLGLDTGLITFVWLIFTVWNALNDPLFAVFQERFISKKYGRRIPYI